jgi:hypothetical protein
MKVHDNITEAKAACDAYRKEREELSERLGVLEDVDDSCVMWFLKVRYRDKDGTVREHIE